MQSREACINAREGEATLLRVKVLIFWRLQREKGMTWRMTVWKGRIREECSEMVKDKNDDMVIFYWTEPKPSPEVLSFILIFVCIFKSHFYFLCKTKWFFIYL